MNNARLNNNVDEDKQQTYVAWKTAQKQNMRLANAVILLKGRCYEYAPYVFILKIISFKGF